MEGKQERRKSCSVSSFPPWWREFSPDLTMPQGRLKAKVPDNAKVQRSNAGMGSIRRKWGRPTLTRARQGESATLQRCHGSKNAKVYCSKADTDGTRRKCGAPTLTRAQSPEYGVRRVVTASAHA